MDASHFLTGSLDKSAKVLPVAYILQLFPLILILVIPYLCMICLLQLWDTRTLKLIKTYATERPVNAVSMSPILDHVCGGVELRNVFDLLADSLYDPFGLIS